MRRLAFLLLPLLSFAFVSPATAADPEPVTTFSWEAPADHVGPLAIRMTFDLGDENRCSFERQVSGRNIREAVHSYEREGKWGGASYSVPTAHAHAKVGDFVVDSRAVNGPGASWSLTMTTEGPYAGVLPFTLVVMDGGSWVHARTGYQPPMRIHMTCDLPFTVGDFWKGYEAVGFTHHSMSGGSGANANQLFGSVSVNQGDAFDASFASGRVEVDISSNKWEGVTMGTLGFEAPSGDRSFDLSSPLDFETHDGAGDYRVTLDYVGVSLSERILGILYGLDPVASLDA